MIEHNKVYVESQVSEVVAEAISHGRLAYEEDVLAFEAAFETKFDLEPGSCIAVSSGSAALFLLLRCLNKSHKTVEIPKYTCASLSKAALMAGYKLSHSDSVSATRPEFLDYSSNSSIIVLPHMCGIESPVQKRSRGHLCIEDATQILGSKNKNGFSGFTTGLSVVSFYATKSLTTLGQGGIVYARDPEIRRLVRSEICSASSYNKMGINLRMPGLNALAGTEALKYIENKVSTRCDIYHQYLAYGLQLVSFPKIQKMPNYYRCLLYIKDKAIEVRDRLRMLGISTICPYEDHELPKSSIGSMPHTSSLVKGLISLPAHNGLETRDIAFISDSVRVILDSLK